MSTTLKKVLFKTVSMTCTWNHENRWDNELGHLFSQQPGSLCFSLQWMKCNPPPSNMYSWSNAIYWTCWQCCSLPLSLLLMCCQALSDILPHCVHSWGAAYQLLSVFVFFFRPCSCTTKWCPALLRTARGNNRLILVFSVVWLTFTIVEVKHQQEERRYLWHFGKDAHLDTVDSFLVRGWIFPTVRWPRKGFEDTFTDFVPRGNRILTKPCISCLCLHP